MRYGMLMLLLVAAGCKTTPSLPSTPDKPSTPAMAPKPSTPAAPSAPSAPSTPAMPGKPSGVPDPGAAAPARAPEAAKAVDRTPIKADVSKIKFKAEPAELFGYDEAESRAFFFTNGLGEVTVKVPADGEYEIVVTAACQAAAGQNAKFKLKVDGAAVGAETQLKSEDAKDYSFTAPLKAGDRAIGTEFTNDLYKEGEYDMNFYLHGLKVVRK